MGGEWTVFGDGDSGGTAGGVVLLAIVLVMDGMWWDNDSSRYDINLGLQENVVNINNLFLCYISIVWLAHICLAGPININAGTRLMCRGPAYVCSISREAHFRVRLLPRF